MFKGPSKLVEFTPASFAELVEDRSSSSTTDTASMWLVYFFAPWSPQCLYLAPVMAEISLQYSNEKLRFGKIDVSRWPAMAKKYKINLLGEYGNQLPTLIMFGKDGKESGRIPHVYNDGKVAAGKFRKKDIVAAFDLEGGGSSSAGGGAGGGGKKKKKNN